MFPSIDRPPTLTSDEMLEVDRIMIEEVGIDLARMMENAGRNLADVVIELFHPGSVTVLAGSGGNGGGVLVAARHLINRGVTVHVAGTRSIERLTPVTGDQAAILGRMGVSVEEEPVEADVVLDGIIGYSLSGPPTGRAREFIEWSANQRVVSLDVPSGLDATSGTAPGACVAAEATMTLALPKRGLMGHPSTGRMFLADISVPVSIYRKFGIEMETPFARSAVVELNT